jgi:Ferritin-like domain
MRIRRLVEHADEQHHEAMRTIAASRRRFVRNLGIGGAAALGATTVPIAVLGTSASAQTSGSTDVELPPNDAVIVDFAVGIELAVAEVYTAALDTGVLEPELAEMIRSFGNHHHEHALSLATLAGRDEETIGLPNVAFLDEFSPRVAAAPTADDLMTVLFEVEQGMAATYAEELGVFESAFAAGPAGAILPVESQHATAIGSTLGLPATDWMPPFQTTEGAFDPATYAG